jgi:hypothetical protein
MKKIKYFVTTCVALMLMSTCYADKSYSIVYCKVSSSGVTAVYDSKGQTQKFRSCSEALSKAKYQSLSYVTTSSNGTESVTAYTFMSSP